ncbi:MAG: hypothetical protein MJ226_07855 [archaeon]|uniref:hypothetical protein n=1 Tax=Methanobrevibacter gottschalkii TaxID=190974 RepID=UPI000B826792|nr:hypothetical protein [Methanobrevibacter gottschalkii]MCQ2971480.1 hypothetical protein [archaeon]
MKNKNLSTTEESRASISERFLEKLLGKSILKSTESQHNHQNQMIMNVMLINHEKSGCFKYLY